MRIEVLGPMRLSTDEGEAIEIPERKVRALLAALVVNAGEAVPAEQLIDRVWGQELPTNPRRVLQAKLSQLRAVLEQAQSGGREYLKSTPGGYTLAVPAESIDAVDFQRRLAYVRGLSAASERAELLAATLEEWRGKPYAELADELWLAAEMRSLEESRIQAVELRAAALVDLGADEEAAALAAPYFEAHPTREALAAPLLLAYYRTRRQPDALAAYERLRSHLAEEFGVDPSPELRDLHLSILRQDPALKPPVSRASGQRTASREARPEELAAHPPYGADSAEGGALQRSRLPSYPSAFLGRAEEINHVSGLLARHRLVTLLGIGGIGKTRLAVQTAQELTSDGSIEVWFVDLSEVHPREAQDAGQGQDQITALTAAALELSAPWQGSSDLPSRIAAALESRQALLVLDNCEHVIDEVTRFAGDLLVRAPGVRILATSREPTGLPEEQRYVVPQLPVNGGASPAVEFFLTRARAVNPAIAAEPHAVEAAAELCRRLDGLPLALELAAARTSVLSVPELLERVTDRLDLLARPDRAAPRRQQTLRGMLDWSWSLLEADERVLLRRLAVHPVTWALDVVEGVCADTDLSPALGESSCPQPEGVLPGGAGEAVLPRRRVLQALSGLVERSLVSTVNVDGHLRYRLLETVGTYAAEKLAESGEREAVALRHLSFHRNLVDCASAYLFGPGARDWVRKLDDARPHLSHAVQEALRCQDGASGVAIVLSTFWYRWMTGRVDSLIEELAAVVACPNPGSSPQELRAYAQAKVLARTVADRPAREKVDQVIQALEAFDTDESGQLARMQVQWFAATVMFGDAEHLDRGCILADEAIEYLLSVGDLQGAAFASTQRDWFLLEFWNMPPRGLPGELDAEQILRDHGDAYGLTQVLGIQHLWAEAEGRRADAERLADEATVLSSDLRLDGESAYWLSIQSVLRLRAGDLCAAAQYLENSRQLARRVAFVYCMRLNDVIAAMLAVRQGETDQAEEMLAGLSAGERESARRTLIRYFGEDLLPAQLQLTRT